jgi:hypothetical protein
LSTKTTTHALVASLASVRDDELAGEAHSPKARALLAEIIATPPEAALPAAPRKRTAARTQTRGLGWLALPAAGLTLAAAVAVVVATGGKGTEPASAATVLHRAATVARLQRPQVLGPGQYLYTKSINAGTVTTVGGPLATAGPYTYLVPHVREIWLGPAGGRLYETSGRPRFLTARDRERWVAAGRPDLTEPPSENKLSPTRPLRLPSEPDSLYLRLKRDAVGHGSGLASEMFTLVGDSLRETDATPAQRAALFEVAARIPGVELVGEVTDPAGRSGVAVAMSEQGVRETLIFDPKTSALLAEEEVALAGNRYGYSAGTRIGYAAYLTQAVVDSEKVRP